MLTFNSLFGLIWKVEEIFEWEGGVLHARNYRQSP